MEYNGIGERRALMGLEACGICPRECMVDRTNGVRGVCLADAEVYLARAALHFWEEPCISGKTGSGAVFFCGCNLHCIYCQNGSISSMKEAKRVSIDRLAEIFLELQAQGAANINLVTPTHYSLQIREAVLLARKQGLGLPIVYNCSGYEKVETLAMLEDVIDIYLTDYKYEEAELADAFSHAPDYPAAAKTALAEMVRQKPSCVFDENGMMREGVIVRHLLLPGHVRNSKAAVEYVYRTYGDRVYLSLMSQYTPMIHSEKYPELNRKTTKREYEKLLNHVLELGVTNAFIQEGGTAKESFIPAFDFEGVLKET